MTINKQALREAAEKADSGEWSYEEFNRLELPGGSFVKIDGRDAVYCLKKPVGGVKQSRAVTAFIAAFNPKVALALLNEVEAAEHTAAVDHEAACSLVEENEELRRCIAELEARIYIPQPLDIEDEYQSYEYVAGWNDCRNAASVRQQTPAVCDVIAERFRQQSVEGWTPEHDDEHCNGELAMAAVCYINETGTVNRNGGKPWGWPWDASWWKPDCRRRNLVKSGALIMAEIERIDRAASIKVKGE
ncbi:ead/Ea22-like family protein [Salmonella enterica]|nr:ead/Ea22-like family protein [Salmonella enterica]